MNGKWITRTCIECGKEFQFRTCWMRNDRSGLYCSKQCMGKCTPHPNQYIYKICEECGKEFFVKKYREYSAHFCSKKCMAVARGRSMRGSNHPFWKGGISERTHTSRRIIRHLINKIGKCQKCGSIENLDGHHIKSWSDYPELRHDENNIMVLCRSCHSKEHPGLAFL